jgi:hypothetical protein
MMQDEFAVESQARAATDAAKAAFAPAVRAKADQQNLSAFQTSGAQSHNAQPGGKGLTAEAPPKI